MELNVLYEGVDHPKPGMIITITNNYFSYLLSLKILCFKGYCFALEYTYPRIKYF